MAEIRPEIETFARIKVIGVGGGGGAAVERMIRSKIHGIEFVVVNTDAQALHYSSATQKIHIGRETTRGLGAGADPGVGRKAAEESENEILNIFKGTDMAFVTFGAGGGTGTGAGPLIAAAAKESGALVVGIVTKPFTFEGEKRKRAAESGIAELKENVDTLITIPNDRLLQMIDRKTSLLDAFSIVDDVLQQGVQGISDLITVPGLINLDFADVKAIMSEAGSALMGIGRAHGENRAIEAAKQAIDSPLLEVSVEGAKGVLFNISGSRNMTMHEIDEAAKTITDAVDPDANIIFGAVLDESLEDDIKITVVATGFEQRHKNVPPQPQLPVEEPVYQRPSVTGLNRPFIDEAPRVFDEIEDDEPVKDETEAEPAKRSLFNRRKTAAFSIEPDEDEVGSTESAPAARAKPISIETVRDHTAEDDLDVPAFIRKKVE